MKAKEAKITYLEKDLRRKRDVPLRQAKKVQIPVDQHPDQILQEKEEWDLRLKVIAYCLEIFPEKRKKVLELMLQDKSEKEIGSIMGIARSTVNQHTRRVKRSLTHYFQKPSLMKK